MQNCIVVLLPSEVVKLHVMSFRSNTDLGEKSVYACLCLVLIGRRSGGWGEGGCSVSKMRSDSW